MNQRPQGHTQGPHPYQNFRPANIPSQGRIPDSNIPVRNQNFQFVQRPVQQPLNIGTARTAKPQIQNSISIPPISSNPNIDTKPDLNPYIRWQRQHEKETAQEQATENYYSGMLLTAIVAIFFYFLGASLIIFFRNVDGQAQVFLPTYELSWRLVFENFGQFFRNLLLNIFGYFIQYAKLFGFFEELGDLTIEARPRFLMPVDIAIKLATIFYFSYRWMSWDTKRCYNLGCFNSKYLQAMEVGNEKEEDNQNKEDDFTPIDIPQPENIDPQFKINQKVEVDLYPKIQTNPYYQAQKLKIDRFGNYTDQEEEDEEEDDLSGLLPFEGVQKPLEEWYHNNEENIYRFIRNNLLPGSNLLLALYFSTLNVLDLKSPIDIVLYILGIMSMFWCMQSFLVILDHNQYPPESDYEAKTTA
jgi:hypothetical protein